jgi:hypothetical protein
MTEMSDGLVIGWDLSNRLILSNVATILAASLKVGFFAELERINE